MITINLRELMAKHRIDNIKELMGISKLSRNSINKLFKEENIKGIKLETLIKLCDTFQCELSELINYVPKSTEEME